MFEFRDVQYKDIIQIPSLPIGSSEITTLVGKSGGGKTTILRLLNKMISPTSGDILFHQQSLKTLDAIEHRRQVVMLSQSPTIFPGNIRDNLIMGLKFHHREAPADEVLKEMLQRVHLDKGLTEETNHLSGGEKQRLALGRVLLLNAPVYLLDEPSSALDDSTEEAIIQMFTSYVKDYNKSLIMVTHSKEMAHKYSDKVITIEKGHVMKEGVR